MEEQRHEIRARDERQFIQRDDVSPPEAGGGVDGVGDYLGVRVEN